MARVAAPTPAIPRIMRTRSTAISTATTAALPVPASRSASYNIAALKCQIDVASLTPHLSYIPHTLESDAGAPACSKPCASGRYTYRYRGRCRSLEKGRVEHGEQHADRNAQASKLQGFPPPPRLQDTPRRVFLFRDADQVWPHRKVCTHNYVKPCMAMRDEVLWRRHREGTRPEAARRGWGRMSQDGGIPARP